MKMKIYKSISVSILIFLRLMFLEVFKMFKVWWYELGNGKKCELQHHLIVVFEKSLDLD
jgi:hypothetical protein